MRRPLAVSSGLAITAVATHGMVSAGLDLDLSRPVPFWSYGGFFQHTILWMSRLWSDAHGWPGPADLSALSRTGHIDDFGRFLAYAVFLLCPLIGFLAYSLVSGSRVSLQWWKPLTIAIAFATPLQHAIHDPAMSLGLKEPLAEGVRATVVFVLMLWSVGAIKIPRWLRPQVPQSAAV